MELASRIRHQITVIIISKDIKLKITAQLTVKTEVIINSTTTIIHIHNNKAIKIDKEVVIFQTIINSNKIIITLLITMVRKDWAINNSKIMKQIHHNKLISNNIINSNWKSNPIRNKIQVATSTNNIIVEKRFPILIQHIINNIELQKSQYQSLVTYRK